MSAASGYVDSDPIAVRYVRPDGPHRQPATEIGPAFTFWRVLLPNGVAVGRLTSEAHAARLVAVSNRAGATVGDLRRAWNGAL